jgi:hypothetical protein
MAKVLGVLAVMALLAVPSTSLAHGHGNGQGVGAALRAAVQQCKQERSQGGVAAFRQKYGKRHAFIKCLRQRLPADRAAAQSCRGERKSMGLSAFQQKYGQPNAIVRCIRAQAG